MCGKVWNRKWKCQIAPVKRLTVHIKEAQNAMVPVTKEPKGKRKTFLMPEKQGEKPREKRAMREGERAQPSIEGRGGCIPTLSAPPSLSHSFPALECVWPYSIRLGVAQSWFLRNQGWLILTRSIMRLVSRLWSECRGCSWCGKYALIMVSIPHTLSGILSVFFCQRSPDLR